MTKHTDSSRSTDSGVSGKGETMATETRNTNRNPVNVALLTTDQLENAWLDVCPSCKAEVSAIKHDFSLCSQLQNALYRIRELESVTTKVRQRIKSNRVRRATV